MTLIIRRLGPGDEPTLALLALNDADFDLDGRSEAASPLSADAARDYLADRGILHWVAEVDGAVAGFLVCYHLRLRADEAAEVLFYEIGVHHGHRRRGVGRALVATLQAWMDERGIAETWVLADNPGAVAFYRACGFAIPEGDATYMTHRRPQ
jgi:ribosomal protein S18 acetylase RimI-like enzyme